MKFDCCNEKRVGKNLKPIFDFLSVISEKNRLKIFCLLKDKEKCVCDIWQCLKLPQNLVSHHLKVMKEFGLISPKKIGLKVFYKLNRKVIKKYSKLLNKFLNL